MGPNRPTESEEETASIVDNKEATRWTAQNRKMPGAFPERDLRRHVVKISLTYTQGAFVTRGADTPRNTPCKHQTTRSSESRGGRSRRMQVDVQVAWMYVCTAGCVFIVSVVFIDGEMGDTYGTYPD